MAQADPIWKRVDIAGHYICLDNFEGDLGDVIEGLQVIKAAVEAKGFRNIQIDRSPGWEPDDIDFELTAERLETLAEAQIRIARAKRSRERRKKEKKEAEERRHQQYLKLKKEYEGG